METWDAVTGTAIAMFLFRRNRERLLAELLRRRLELALADARRLQLALEPLLLGDARLA